MQIVIFKMKFFCFIAFFPQNFNSSLLPQAIGQVLTFDKIGLHSALVIREQEYILI